jgi:hypothetical protein
MVQKMPARTAWDCTLVGHSDYELDCSKQFGSHCGMSRSSRFHICFPGLWIAVALFALVGCEAVPPETPGQPVSGDAAAAAQTPEPGEDGTAPQSVAEAATGRLPHVPPEGPLLDPEALIGLVPDQAEILLGHPTEVREEAPALVWSYKVDRCVVELYFYASVDDCFNRVVSQSHARR